MRFDRSKMGWMFAAAGANASVAVARQPALPEVPATFRILFDEGPDIRSVAFAPDCASIYALVGFRAVDVWAAAIHFWPEELGVVLGLAILSAVLIAWRVSRRRQRKGDPHCRKCNYNLSGLVATTGDGDTATSSLRCPECGADLARRPPMRGRSLSRRLALVAMPATALGMCYGAMLVSGVPRDGAASRWFAWPSADLQNWAEQNGVSWVQPFSTYFERIVQVDLLTGTRSRSVRTQVGLSTIPLGVSPSGDTLFIRDGRTHGILQIDAQSGRVRCRVKTVGVVPPDTPGVIGFADNGATVYIGFLDRDNGTNVVAAWRPPAETVERLFETPAHLPQPGRAQMLRSDGPSFLTTTSFMEAYETKHYRLSVRTPDGSAPREIDLGDAPHANYAPAVSADGSSAFVAVTNGVLGVDLASGELLGTVQPPQRDWVNGDLTADSFGRLFVAVHPVSVLVRDTMAGCWLARLTIPKPLIGPELTASPDGRWVAAVVFQSAPRTGIGPNVHELLLYDLTKLPAPPK